ncbi:hypothetical protein [Longispora albida]|uniref:hypothetical protein n=1 Tax=Longispora albida TaxID=203523 RepID=UPI00035F46AF|nr:hypothetical protein [Longispora albida]
MDQLNPYESPVTFKLHRAEYLVAFALSIILIIVHFTEIRWIPFILLFAWIDLVGYIPGAIAFRRSPDGRISKTYYVLYNFAHSLITQMAVIGLWLYFVGPEWALLAIPFHVLGDRGLFGNFLKPFGQTFEPMPNPMYQQLAERLRSRSDAVTRVPAPLAEDVPADVKA